MAAGGIGLKDMQSSELTEDLRNWFERSKELMSLSNVTCRFIENNIAKKATGNTLMRVGAWGEADPEKSSFAFVESDDGRKRDREVMIHEMLHLKGWQHKDEEFWLEDQEAEEEK